jgi:hypothetical protein
MCHGSCRKLADHPGVACTILAESQHWLLKLSAIMVMPDRRATLMLFAPALRGHRRGAHHQLQTLFHALACVGGMAFEVIPPNRYGLVHDLFDGAVDVAVHAFAARVVAFVRESSPQFMADRKSVVHGVSFLPGFHLRRGLRAEALAAGGGVKPCALASPPLPHPGRKYRRIRTRPGH